MALQQGRLKIKGELRLCHSSLPETAGIILSGTFLYRIGQKKETAGHANIEKGGSP